MADYVKMWEDLGMDINNHDNLCQVKSWFTNAQSASVLPFAWEYSFAFNGWSTNGGVPQRLINSM